MPKREPTSAEFWTEANLSADPESSGERVATCCQPRGNREAPTFLPVSIGKEKAAHHAGLVGMCFRPPVVFGKDRSSRLVFLHARPRKHNHVELGYGHPN